MSPPGLPASRSPLALPQIGRAEAGRTIKFIPQADLTVLDPHWTTAYVTRNHGFMVFDTLEGQDGSYRSSPQMVEGHTVSDDGRTWRLTLRPGLRFHGNEPVRAQDCVASIQRRGSRDGFGQALLAATDTLTADGDRVIVFRLKRPFPPLPDALGKSARSMPAMMPERLARSSCATIGSSPRTRLRRSPPAQKKVAEALPVQALTDVPHIPLGRYLQATAYRDTLTRVPNGFAIFWSVRKA